MPSHRQHTSDSSFSGLEPLEGRTLMSSSLALTGPTIASLSAPTTSIVTADFTADGVPDVAIAAGRQILLLAGRGDGTFAPPIVAATLNAFVGLLAVGNFDGDPYPDLVAAQRSQDQRTGSGWLRVLRNDASNRGRFHATVYARFTGRAASLTTANLDGDTHRDILLTTEPVFLNRRGDSRRATLDWYEPTGGAIQFRKRLDIAPPSIFIDDFTVYFLAEAPPVVADLDGDGRDEVIAIARTAQNGSRVRLLRFDGTRMAATSTVILDTNVTSGAVADLFAEGHTRLVYSAQTDHVDDYYNPTTESVGTIDILRPISGPPTLDVVGPPIWTRTAADFQGLVGNGPADSLRIVAVGDVNSDGFLDVALEATYIFFSSSAPTKYVQSSFSQVVQSPARVFRTADTHSTTLGTVFDDPAPFGGIDSDLPLFTLADFRRNGRLDLLKLSYPFTLRGYTDLSSPQLMLLPNTAAWKPPEITYNSLASTLAVELDVASAELARGANVSHVRVYQDSNANGVLDANDALVGIANTPEYPNYPDRTDSFWRINYSSPVPRLTVLFAQAEDSTGALSEPLRFTAF